MKVEYCLQAQGDVWAVGTTTRENLDGIEITWKVTGGKLDSITLTLLGAVMKADPVTKRVQTINGEIEDRMFTVATYITNRIKYETGVDAIDPQSIIGNSPVVEAESVQEEAMLQRGLTVAKAARVSALVQAQLDLTRIPHATMIPNALAHFAEAQRTISPFIRFEQLYKVLECFFDGDGVALDQRISGHAVVFDQRFNQSKIETFRLLRNRSTHSRARLGHMNSRKLQDVAKISAELADLQDLARLLIAHPPSGAPQASW